MAPKPTKATFSKPGQKKKTPAKDDSLMKFYSSLYKQNKDSNMAIKWMIEHGAFSKKKAEVLLLTLEMNKIKI
jgi:hypothetical protein